MPDQYVWLVWSSAFLVPWLGAYVAFPRHRKAMVWASLITAPLGLTEPLFVPDYWNPPSLFDLARRSGFDIESVIFSFAIGGIGAVLYNLLTGRALLPVSTAERHSPRHKMHYWALAVPFLSFPPLYLLRWNPIYPAIVAMTLGAAATMLCRPDLVRKKWIGALLFLAYYSPVSARSRMDGTRLHWARLEPGRSFRPEYFRHALGGTALCRRFRRILVRCLRSLHLEDLVATVTERPRSSAGQIGRRSAS
jgi:hypothetical protein